jgi:hypothetical protein
MSTSTAGRKTAGSVEELLAGAGARAAMKTGDSKSGAAFERIDIDGIPHVVKYLHADDDWIMRVTGDVRCRPALVWSSGLLDVVPECIDPGMVGCAVGLGRNGWGAALLMPDVTPLLVPEGDAPVPIDQHLRFLDHMAALHAAFWTWEDTVGLLPPPARYSCFAPSIHTRELERPEPDRVPLIAHDGWLRFRERVPDLAVPVLALADDPSPLLDALATTPHCFLHGDWKLGNLGSHPDGRTILLDWAVPGRGAPCSELAWYLALNRARIPQSKEASIAAYRGALERYGVATGDWWDRQLPLALLGGLVQFGWEKALGDDDELAWWCGHAAAGLALLAGH